jgi:DMSO/TMAO reductase YedYZ molybdopterin-dependent catalytic subunit
MRRRRVLLGIALTLGGSLAAVSCQSPEAITLPGLTVGPELAASPSATPSLNRADAMPPTPTALATPPTPVATPIPSLDDLIQADPAKVDVSHLRITPVDEMDTTGTPPEVDIEAYHLAVTGAVETPLSLTYQEVLDRPVHTEVVLLICPGFFADNVQWCGVPLSALLEEAGVQPGATTVVLRSLEDWSTTLTLEEARRDGYFLAHTANGQTLPLGNGYPLRLVRRGAYGGRWLKWVHRIEVG